MIYRNRPHRQAGIPELDSACCLARHGEAFRICHRCLPTTTAVLRFAIILLLSTAVSTGRTQDSLGLSVLKPPSGRYVKTDGGYMVAYRTTIPGTEISFEMVPVPGGVLRLGGRDDSVNPVSVSEVEVTVAPFWLGRCEVTWAEYNEYCKLLEAFRRFEQLGVREVTSENQRDAVTAPSVLYETSMYYPATGNKKEWPKHPAAAMTQYGAKQYTKWLSQLTGDFYRLPSEAEWEYACRAGGTGSYCFGDDERRLGDYAWYFDNSDEDTHPVGLKKPNHWGLYDMHGNVSEWVLDQYSETRVPLRQAAAAGKQPIHWPTRLHPRTVCGGSWDADAVDCRNASRRGSSVDWQEEEAMFPPSPHWLASYAAREIGFRIARPLHAPRVESRAKYWDADVDELREAVADYCKTSHSFLGIVDPQLPAAVKRIRD